MKLVMTLAKPIVAVLCRCASSTAFFAALVFAGSVQAQTLVYCSEGSPEGFNPALYTSVTTFDATRQIFDQLTERDPKTLAIKPALAESWEISEDGKTYTFHLRKDVQFHSNELFQPTRAFNADDVLFSLERQLDPKNLYHGVSGGQYTVLYAMDLPALIERIQRLDDHTLWFQLSRPSAAFLATLTMDFASTQSTEYAESLLHSGTPEQIDLKPIDTGPFSLVVYLRDTAVRYRAFEDHWRGRPQISNLVFDITVDPSVRFLKLRAGECQLIAYPNPADLDDIERDPNLVLETWEGFNVGYLAFNIDKPPFEDVRVRRALTYAIDRRAILDIIYEGTASLANAPIPPPSWAYDADLEGLAYDPQRARELLAEAGYENGFTTDIWAMTVQRPYNPNARRMAELIQADSAKVGVRARIVSYEWGEYLRRSKLGEHETLLLGWGGQNGDPDDFLSPLLSCHAKHTTGLNRAHWCNAAFDQLLAEARVISDIPARKALYDRAQEIFQQQAPWVTIAHAHVQEAIRKEVRNYQTDPFGRHIFFPVSLAADGD